MDVAKENSMKKTRSPGGDQSQDRDMKLLASTAEIQITRKLTAGNTREILQRVKLLTRTSKRPRMAPA